MFPIPGIFNQQAPAVEAPIPQVFWPMQEGTGTTFTDTIGSKVATLSSATWNVGGGRGGSNCVSFTTGQFAYIADPFYYDPMSVCFWVYPTTTGLQKSMIVKRNDTSGSNIATSNDFEIGLNTANKIYFWAWAQNGTPGILGDFFGATAVPANQWSHIAVSLGGDDQTCYIYLNGVIDASTTQTVGLNNGVSSFQFGGRSSNIDSRYFLGSMQEVRVYNYRLSETEMGAVVIAETP